MIEKEKVNLSWNRETIAVKMGRDLGEKPFNFLLLFLNVYTFQVQTVCLSTGLNLENAQIYLDLSVLS